MESIITYELSKHYQGKPALSRVSLQVPQGKSVACVGPEGAGKTTLLRLLSGLYRPSAGDCSVLGLSPFFEADRLHALMGTVLGSARLYRRMTISENLRFFAGLSEVDENDAIDRLSFLLHRLDIWESREEKAANVTTGVLHRASLARALMHRPQVLLMDAPAGGFDRESADAIRGLLSYLTREEGVTLLFCTEHMDYAQEICDGFFLLDRGELIARGNLEHLRVGAGVNCRALLRLAEGEEPPRGFRAHGDSWQKEIKNDNELPMLISQLAEDGKHIYEARIIRPGLEEIYAAYLAGGVYRAGENIEQNDENESRADAADGKAPGDAQPPHTAYQNGADAAQRQAAGEVQP